MLLVLTVAVITAALVLSLLEFAIDPEVASLAVTAVDSSWLGQRRLRPGASLQALRAGSTHRLLEGRGVTHATPVTNYDAQTPLSSRVCGQPAVDGYASAHTCKHMCQCTIRQVL